MSGGSTSHRWRRLWQRLATTFDIRRRPSARRPPPVGVGTGRSIRAWQVHVATACLTIGVGALAASTPWEWTVVLFLTGLITVWPAGLAPMMLAVALGVAFAFSPPDGAVFAAAVALLHLLFVTYSVAGDLPRSTRIEFAALAPPMRRFLTVQAVAQPLAATALLLEGTTTTIPWLAVVAVAAVGTLSWWLLASVSGNRTT